MPWYLFSLLAMLASAWYSLSQKWALNLKIDKTKLLLYVFWALFFSYLIYNLIIDRAGLFSQLHSKEYLLLGLLASSFSIVGNIAQIKAFDESPNPGYVSAIVVINALFITVIAALFLGKPVTLLKGLGIVVIVVGLILLLIDKGRKLKSGNWKAPAILAMVLYGFLQLMFKYMTDRGISPSQVLLIIVFWASIGFLILSLTKKISWRLGKTPKLVILPVALAVAVAFFSNLLNVIAIRLVSNPGYATAILNSSVILILFLSPLLFPKQSGGEINSKKWLGVAITTAGIVLVILG